MLQDIAVFTGGHDLTIQSGRKYARHARRAKKVTIEGNKISGVARRPILKRASTKSRRRSKRPPTMIAVQERSPLRAGSR